MSIPPTMPDASMDDEHEAWTEMLARLVSVTGVLDFEINEPRWEPLISQIEWWGETLVRMRMQQGEDTVERAYEERKRLAAHLSTGRRP